MFLPVDAVVADVGLPIQEPLDADVSRLKIEVALTYRLPLPEDRKERRRYEMTTEGVVRNVDELISRLKTEASRRHCSDKGWNPYLRGVIEA